ncbi:MAG TPA: 1-deoxy-D-xylulose-5-phosphate synthase [Coriobacteriia bacterium]
MSDSILDTITTPEDLKPLSGAQLRVLAQEIRECLVSTVSKTGGHLAPNLGVVELTLGLLRALDTPRDRVIWDVGHQAYVYKLLTGRRERFSTLRQYGGVCGFPKRSESVYDVFDTGHASNSISVALGVAQARDARGSDEQVVAVIGDGSLTGGMAFEALNHAGHLGTKMIVVLNDNEMSISENVGALASYLARVRLDPRYIRLREDVEGAISKVPRIGAGLVAAGEAAKESFKQLVVPGMLFEELGWKYVGPINGHDIDKVQDAVSRARSAEGPVIIHVVTHKGQGYAPAEDSPDTFHGVAPFEVSTGKINGKAGGPPSFTEVFSEAIVAEAARDERICAITAAMPTGTGLDLFASTYPDRFYDVGIAEQHAVGFAAGLAVGGRRPVVAIYSTFIQRAFDQVVMDVCLQNLPVVFALDRAGLVGEDGPTHHGVFDMSFLRAVPNLTICTPADEAELVDMLHTGLASDGPFAIRYPRGKAAGVALPREPSVLEAGRAQVRRTGTDVALLAWGRMVGVAERAASALMEAGVSASVVNMRWVKPIDMETVAWAAQTHDLVVTIEENTVLGGAGSAVLESLADMGMAPAVMHLGVPDCFVTHGAMDRLLSDVRLTPEGVCEAVLGRLERVVESEGERHGQTQSRRRAR